MQNNIRLLKVCAFLLISPGFAVKATCSWVNSSFSRVDYTYTPAFNSTVSATTSSYIIDQKSLSAKELATGVGATNASADIVQCTSGADIIQVDGSQFSIGQLKGNSSFYFHLPNTEIGIGFFIRSSLDLSSSASWVYPGQASGSNYTVTLDEIYANRGTSFNERNGMLSWQDILGTGANGLSIYTYKSSGAVGSGTLPGGTAGHISASGLTLANLEVSSVSVTSSSCAISSHDHTVDLGTVYRQQFQTAGKTSDNSDFSIALQCDSYNLQPTLTFSGTPDTNNTQIFANTSGSAAGVGIQLLYDNVAIKPDVAVDLGHPASVSSPIYYNFSARIYQTLSTVTAGSIDANINFTLKYQ